MKQSAIELFIKQLVSAKKLNKNDVNVKMTIALAKALERENILDAHYESGQSLSKAQKYYTENYG